MGDAWKDIEYTFSEEELYGNKLCVSALVPDYPTEYLPQKKTSGAAGYDLVSIQETFQLHPGDIVKVSTGLAWQIPSGKFGMVCSRSGLATKGVLVVNAPGIVDSDYRGEVMVILGNISRETYLVKKFDRIAQMVVVADSAFRDVPILRPHLFGTERGAGGFGSTGN